MKPYHQILNKNVLIHPLEKETVAGVALAKSYEDKFYRGEVIQIADDVTKVCVGQVIGFQPYAPEKVETRGKEYLLVKEEDIWFIENSGV